MGHALSPRRTDLAPTDLDRVRFAFAVCRDGRVHEGDQILAIDGQPLDSNISHLQAISILQKARGLVELVVARTDDGVDDAAKAGVATAAGCLLSDPPAQVAAAVATTAAAAPAPPSPSAVSDTSKAGSDMVVSRGRGRGAWGRERGGRTAKSLSRQTRPRRRPPKAAKGLARPLGVGRFI